MADGSQSREQIRKSTATTSMFSAGDTRSPSAYEKMEIFLKSIICSHICTLNNVRNKPTVCSFSIRGHVYYCEYEQLHILKI